MVPEEGDLKGQINSWALAVGQTPIIRTQAVVEHRGQWIGCGAGLGWDLGVLSTDYIGLGLVRASSRPIEIGIQ